MFVGLSHSYAIINTHAFLFANVIKIRFGFENIWIEARTVTNAAFPIGLWRHRVCS